MKKIVLLFVTINFLSLLSYAQSPNWLWAKSAGGTDFDFTYSVAVDVSGNAYVAGFYSNSSITFGANTLTNVGARDMFLAKYDAAANVVWAKSAGGTDVDEMRSLAVDASGNTYVTGWFKSSSFVFGTSTLTNAGDGDMFLAKYDALGNVVWVKSAGGQNTDIGSSVALDVLGNTYLVGFFSSSTINFGTTTLTNAGDYDMFLVKYDATGNVVWAKSAGGSALDGALSFAVDAYGNAYVAGYYESPTLIFGSTTLTNAGSGDIFLVKYNASGNVVWAKSAGGTGLDEAMSIAVDASGNTYVAGYFSSYTLLFGSTTLTSLGSEDIFLAKYDVNGNVVWAKKAGGMSDDRTNSIAVDAYGNTYVAGYFSSTNLDFGATTLINTGQADIFLARYDAIGNVIWAKSVGGTSDDRAISSVVDAYGNIYLTGSFCSDTFAFGSITLTSAGACDIFLAKLNNTIGINEIHNLNSISVYPNPVRNELIIETNTNTKQSLELLNLLGQTVYTSSFNKKATLNTSAFPNGAYILKLYKDKEMIVKKFIKQ
jgi:hypothetical protein